MAIIKSPNKEYTGVSASVSFVNGTGETNNPNLIEWFKRKGYKVIDKKNGEQKETIESNVNNSNDGEIPDNQNDEKSTQNDEWGEADDTSTVEASFEDLKNDELRALLDEKGIEYRKNDTKETLIGLLGE